MIEKLTNYSLTGLLDRKGTVPSSFSGTASPFHNILNNEMTHSASLEKMVLDFLIKTIESILSKADQTDQWSSFSRTPSCWGDPFWQPLPASKKSVIRNRSQRCQPANRRDRKLTKSFKGRLIQYGVEPSLIKAVISVESNGNPQAVSPAGAQGLMQLMPKTAAELGVTDPFDPAQNIKAGTQVFKPASGPLPGKSKAGPGSLQLGHGQPGKKSRRACPKKPEITLSGWRNNINPI